MLEITTPVSFAIFLGLMISCMQFNEWMLIVLLKQRWISVLDMHAEERLEKALRMSVYKFAWGWNVCNIGILCWNDITVKSHFMVTHLIWLPHYHRQGAFHSAQNSGILVRNQTGRDHFGLVQPGYLGPPLKVVHFDWPSYLGRSDWNVPFHLT